MKNLYAVDLFCGCGGMAEGILKAGFKILFANDISKYASLTYRNRHTQLGLIDGVDYCFYEGDIKDINGKFIFDSIRTLPKFVNEDKLKINVVFGGPPCQGFSLAGRRKHDDPRNFLFKEYIRVVGDLKPDYVVMENVPGFLSTKLLDYVASDGEKYSKEECLAPHILEKEFKKIGYKILKPKIFDTSKYGVPQTRKRVIFLAYSKNAKKPNFPKQTCKKPVSLAEAIGDFYDEKYFSNYISDRKVNCNTVYNFERSSINLITAERFSLYKDGESTKDVKARLQTEGFDLTNCPNLTELLSISLNLSKAKILSIVKNGSLGKKGIDILLTKKNVRKKLSKNKPAQTVVTIPDDYINPFNNQIFTVRELARLQSFDDDFVFYGKRTTGGQMRKKETPQYTQVGNAVPPLFSFALANNIFNLYEEI